MNTSKKRCPRQLKLWEKSGALQIRGIPNWKLCSGEKVVDRFNSHLHDDAKLMVHKALKRVNSCGEDFIKQIVEFDGVIGKCSRVNTSPADEIIYAQRLGREGLTRFVKNRKLEDCNSLVVILKRISDEQYVLITAFVGTLSEPEPWDKRATDNSVKFWSENALVWGSEKIVEGTKTPNCPW